MYRFLLNHKSTFLVVMIIFLLSSCCAGNYKVWSEIVARDLVAIYIVSMLGLIAYYIIAINLSIMILLAVVVQLFYL